MSADTMELDRLAGEIKTLAQASGIEVKEQVLLPERSAAYLPVPEQLHPDLRGLLSLVYRRGLYAHQARAIEAVVDGEDICLATPTASGKSLVFMASAMELLLRDPTARVIALYPAKALIHDQMAKWAKLMQPFGMRPGYIDGGVPVATRSALLRNHRLVLMTPDVAHAWLMSHLTDRAVLGFLSGLKLLILDEAHVYDGVFGTHMAYFLRRLRAVSPVERIVSATATVGAPADFIAALTGRRPRVLTREDDGSASPAKAVMLAHPAGGALFEHLVDLLRRLSRAEIGRFLAFGDSRKMVEQLVAQSLRGTAVAAADEGEPQEERSAQVRVLPYRAGYEEDDRQAIHRALERGDLAGVVSTSALELGLDIGDLDIVILLGTPATVKAFWQRLGRAGRKRPGVCLLIDDRGLIDHIGGLQQYLRRAPEPSWLYLGNRQIQYAHTLCAATECNDVGRASYALEPFASVPPAFVRLLENELNPTESVPTDLYTLKQRAQGGPHHEFPLRSGIEPNFDVRDSAGSRFGTLTFSQALREAYPGAVYYYLARPYRVCEFRYRSGEIRVKRDRSYITRPLLQARVFPKLPGGMLHFARLADGFVCEAEMQVSERVIGFQERRGKSTVAHEYGSQSHYAQAPVSRFFETTGVCWYLPRRELLSEALAAAVLEAFCALCGVQERDLGVGQFLSRTGPLGEAGACQGVCVYDTSHGSLRLTQPLLERFAEVLELAASMAEQNKDQALAELLHGLHEQASQMQHEAVGAHAPAGPLSDEDGDWMTVVADGERAMYVDGAVAEEVCVITHRYTPHGLMYQLVTAEPDAQRRVAASHLVPINGVSRLQRVNLMTGEAQAA